MSRILCIVVATFFLNLSFSQINVQWESRFNGVGNFIDKAVDLELDASGNTYVTGSSFSGSDYDWVTIKYDANGVLIWMKTYGGSGLDEASAITLDGNNDVIVTGSRYNSGSDWDIAVVKYNGITGNEDWAYLHTGSSNFDGGKDVVTDTNNDVVLTGTLSASSTNVNWIVLKCNSITGALAWQQSGGTSGNDEGKVVLTDALNNVYVAGHSEFSSGSTYFDFLVMKFSPTGGTPTFSSTQDAGFNGLDTPHAMALDASGNIFVGGQGFNAPIEEEDYVLMKFDNSCVFQWTRTYAGDATVLDKINALAVDQVSGNVFVTGRSKSIASSEDYYTIGYDNNGLELWNDRYTSSGLGFDEATDIKMSASGFIYITGYSFETGSNNDYTTLKYDTNGNLIWDTRFDGPSGLSDQAVKMQLDATENIFVTGTSHGGGTNLDYSTIKYCQLTTVASTDTALCFGQSVNLTATGGTNITWSVVSGDFSSLSCSVCGTTTASPSSTSVYKVSSTSASGCVDFDTVIVTVNSIPTPIIYNDTPLSFCTGDSVVLYTDSYSDYLWSPIAAVDSLITVYTSDNYTVTITDSNGCQNSANVMVTAFSLPTVDAGTGFSLCPGDSGPLNATGAVNYVWDVDVSLSQLNIPNPIVTPTVQGWYYVTGEDANNCFNIDSIQISLHTLPTVNAGFDAQICVGDSTQLNATGANDYVWNTSSTLTDLSIPNPYAFPSSLTTYTVTGTDGNGCTDQSSVNVSTLSLPGVDAGATNSHCIGDSTHLFATGALVWQWTADPTISDETINNPWVTPITDTWYYVSGTDVNLCTNIDSVFITVDPLPNVSAGNNFSICEGDNASLTATGATTYQWDFHPTFTTMTNISNPVAQPITLTTFTVTGLVSSTGCENTASVTVDINPLPIIDAGIDTSMCVGDSLQLLATGGDTYIWSTDPSLSSNIVPNPWSDATVDTWYFLDAYDSNSCFGEDSVLVEVHPLPSSPVIFEVNEWLISSYTTGNQWYFNGSAVSGGNNDSLNWVAAAQNGSYTLLYTDANGCEKFSEVTNIIIIDDIGYEDNVGFNVKMYPNPTFGMLKIDIDTPVDYIQVIGMNGQVVYSEKEISSGLIEIDLSELKSGGYVIQVLKGSQLLRKKIIVK